MTETVRRPRFGELGGTGWALGLMACALVIGTGVAGAVYGSTPVAAGTLSLASAYLVVVALRLTGPGSAAGALLSAVAIGAAVAGATYGAAPLLVVAVPLGVFALVLAVLRPALAVAASLLLTVLDAVQVPLGALGALSATEICFLLVAAGWCWRALVGDPGVRYPQIADFPMIALVLALLPGLVLGVQPAVVLRLVVLYGAFFLVFLTVKGLSPNELRMVVAALAVGAGVMGAAALVDYAAGGGVTVSGDNVGGRAAFGIADPNYFAAYVLVATVPAVAALVSGGRVRGRPVLFGAVAVAGLALLLTFSRGALLGALTAVAVVVLAWSRTRALSVFTAVVVGLTAAANINPVLNSRTSEVVAGRLSSITDSTPSNNRLSLWSRSLEVVQQQPQGLGVLQFSDVSRDAGITERGQPLENAHNAYLNVAVELGLLGLVAYLLWLARITWDVAVEWRRRRADTFPLAVGAAAALVGFAVQGLTIAQYRVQVVLAVMFVVTGVAAAARAAPDDAPNGSAVEHRDDQPTAGG